MTLVVRKFHSPMEKWNPNNNRSRKLRLAVMKKEEIWVSFGKVVEEVY